MDALEIINRLTTVGCRLIHEGERLRVQDPSQALTDEWRALIRVHKGAMLTLLRERPAMGHPTQWSQEGGEPSLSQNSHDSHNMAPHANAARPANGAPTEASHVVDHAALPDDVTSGPPQQPIRVPYQRIWFDYDVPDGSYTPEELQRANKVVKRGALQSYTLRWPPTTA